MREAEEEIGEIKKEIIESRGLIIKTNNLTNALAADIKSIAKRQAGYERRFNWNSGVAYVLFAALSFVGLKLWSDVRFDEIGAETTSLREETRRLRIDLRSQSDRLGARERAEGKAAVFYELIRQRKRRDVVEGFDAIRQEPITKAEAAFFRDTADQFRLDLSIEAYSSGLELMGTGRYAEAAEAFRESIDLRNDATHLPAVRYHLARAERALGNRPEAMLQAQRVIDQNIDRELQDDAAFLLAECAEETGQIDDARNALRLLLRRWPRSSLAADARKKLGELNGRAVRGGR